MIATDVARAALHALLAVLIFTDLVEIWHLVVIEALFGTAEAFFRPAYTGLLPRTVPEAEIQEAQAISNITNNLAELTGPALATALVLGVGAGWAFALDAATFAVSAAFPPASGRPTRRRPPRSGGPCSPSSPRASATCARARGCGSRSPSSRSRCRSATRRCSCSGRRSPRTATTRPRCSGS